MEDDKDLIESFEEGFAKGTVISHLTPARKAELQAAARATLNPPRKQISTRLPENDLARLKARALELGMPYQTLLASIVHRYVEGRLVEKD